MKSVAIIGAGPSGLVAARSFLRKEPRIFDVSVFDKQDRVGGMWAVEIGEQDKMLNPDMPTNGSRFSESLSDLSWRSVDLSHPSKPRSPPGFIPTFPRAWQVGRYLETYARRLIPRDVLHLSCEVTEAVERLGGNDKHWRLTWKDHASGNSHARYFDYLVIASGFFNVARPSEWEQKLETAPASKSRVKMVHSSRCRSLSEDVAPDNWDGEGNILVVGGSMSGAEAATALAFQISDRKHAPGAKPWGSPKIVHVVPRPFYAVPPLLPKIHATEGLGFTPSDLYFFSLDRRTGADIKAGSGRLPAPLANKIHDNFQNLVGDQTDLGAAALVTEDAAKDQPAYVAITAGGMYSEFVRDSTIQPVTGRVDQLVEDDCDRSLKARTYGSDGAKTIENICGVVYATGYTPMPILDIFSQEVKQELEHHPESHRLPLILHAYNTFHPGIPQLGFVGYYEAPYWSVMELQARLLVQVWSDIVAPRNDKYWHMQEAIPTLEKMRDLRSAMLEKQPDVPQYWNNDNVGLLEEISTELGIRRCDEGFGAQKGPVAIARYCDENCDAEQAQLAREDLQQMLRRSETEGLFVACAAFRAMHGEWKMHRELKSVLSSMPSGTFIGKAQFYPRAPTANDCVGEYLYLEEGEFSTTTGFKMNASRRYAFRYHENTDKITSWFVKEDGLTIDYLFLDLELQPKKRASVANSWIATSRHPCAPDMYDAMYDWRFEKAALGSFKVVYKVKGPQKDYVSTTWYTR